MGVMRATRSDSAARPELSAADRERLARRYPGPRLPRPVLIAIIAVVAAGSLSWLIWTALVHAEPVVSAKVAAYTVVSDSRIDATVIIDRPDPSIPVVCRVSAQAEDFQPVGEVNLAGGGDRGRGREHDHLDHHASAAPPPPSSASARRPDGSVSAC